MRSSSGGGINVWPRGPLGRVPALHRGYVGRHLAKKMKCPFPGPTATRCCSYFKLHDHLSITSLAYL